MGKFFNGADVLVGSNTIPGVKMPEELKRHASTILKACEDYGLDFFPTNIQLMTYDDISEIAAYGGFPVRYPHWSWGMEYEKLQRGYELNMGKIHELVINSNPVVMYCLFSNSLLDNLTVIAHATGHNDFFKNNIFFEKTNRDAVNLFANHATRIRKYMDRWGKEKVTEFIDHVNRLQTLVDPASAWEQKQIKDLNIQDSKTTYPPRRFKIDQDRLYMDDFINNKKFIEQDNLRIAKKEIEDEMEIFKSPTKDILGYLRDHAPLKPWQQDVISMLHEEAMYFYPQRITQATNEGHACLKKDSLIPTNLGVLKIQDIVNNKIEAVVYDGENHKKITNWFKFNSKKTVKLISDKGYEIDGSDTHKVIHNGIWKRLDEIKIGDEFDVNFTNVWTDKYYDILHNNEVYLSYSEMAKKYNINSYCFAEVLKGNLKVKNHEKGILAVEEYNKQKEYYIKKYNTEYIINKSRKSIILPNKVCEDFGAFLGYIIGDGHITSKRQIGITTGDFCQASRFNNIVKKLFNIDCTKKKIFNEKTKKYKYRYGFYSNVVRDLLVSFGFKIGVAARTKQIPNCILQSPKSVVIEFLKAYYDCDGCATKSGVAILSTSSEELGKQVQNLLLNFEIFCSRIKVKTKDVKKQHVWQVHCSGINAKLFYEKIGFNLKRKQNRLKLWLKNKKWFLKTSKKIKIIAIESGIDDVYDFTVEDTHKYSALGFINHNSFVDYEIMARQGYCSLGQESHSSGIVEYSDLKWRVLGGKYSMNPYKTGFTLLLDIEERWNKGQFGLEWENCTDANRRKNWDTKANLGKEKIFEVRKFYNDYLLIDEFFTEDFCIKNEYFEWEKLPNGEYVISNRDYYSIKNKLKERYLNGGLPEIQLVDDNHKGKDILFLEHLWTGKTLYERYLKSVLSSIEFIWGRGVVLSTKNKYDQEIVCVCKDKNAFIESRESYEAAD